MEIEFWQVAVSLILIGLTLGVSLYQALDLEKEILWATLRATVQLIAVGALFAAIFSSANAPIWAGVWVLVMVIVAAVTVMRRSDAGVEMFFVGLVAIGITAVIVLFVLFVLGVMDTSPTAVVVMAGITIGNTLPVVVQAIQRTRTTLAECSGQIEAMLALGFGARKALSRVVHDVVKLALVPQVEKTKVVGLVSLPGAVTGLLLAGVKPLDAVLVQLVVMFLVIGCVAIATIIVTTALTRRALTADLRLKDSVRRYRI